MLNMQFQMAEYPEERKTQRITPQDFPRITPAPLNKTIV
jgi:hypothetical protein